MRTGILCGLTLFLACTKPAAIKPPASDGWRSQARALERASGSLRDYRGAVHIYQRACNDGRGDIAACWALLDALEHERGMIAPREALQQLLGVLCDRGSKRGCALATFVEVRPQSVQPHPEAMRKQCAAGDVDACEALPVSTWYGDGSSEQAKAEADVHLACAHDAVDWCEKTPAQLAADCRDGDAYACDGVPGHQISAIERCEAGDYEQCWKAGYNGRAGAVACAGGVREACDYATDTSSP